MGEIECVYRASSGRYGVRKVWRQRKREQFAVARCTTERLMAKLGLQGVRRGKRWKTTIPDEAAEKPLDLVYRELSAQRPNQLWVADFTYVPTWQGVVYVVFILDVFARKVVGWRVSKIMRTDLVLAALEQANWAQGRPRGVTHHSDRGSQYLSLRYSDRLAEAGFEPSVGSKGDSCDSAMAESLIGLFKTKVINERSSWKTFEEVEYATLTWIDWYNKERLHGALGYVPPVEFGRVHDEGKMPSGLTA